MRDRPPGQHPRLPPREACRRIHRVERRHLERNGTVGHDWALMYKWFNDHGYDVDIEALRKGFGIPLTSFADYLARSGLGGRKAA